MNFEGKHLYLVKEGVVSEKLSSTSQIEDSIQALQENLSEIAHGIIFLYESGFEHVAWAIDQRETGDYNMNVGNILNEAEKGDKIDIQIKEVYMN